MQVANAVGFCVGALPGFLLKQRAQLDVVGPMQIMQI